MKSKIVKIIRVNLFGRNTPDGEFFDITIRFDRNLEHHEAELICAEIRHTFFPNFREVIVRTDASYASVENLRTKLHNVIGAL